MAKCYTVGCNCPIKAEYQLPGSATAAGGLSGPTLDCSLCCECPEARLRLDERAPERKLDVAGTARLSRLLRSANSSSQASSSAIGLVSRPGALLAGAVWERPRTRCSKPSGRGSRPTDRFSTLGLAVGLLPNRMLGLDADQVLDNDRVEETEEAPKLGLNSSLLLGVEH